MWETKQLLVPSDFHIYLFFISGVYIISVILMTDLLFSLIRISELLFSYLAVRTAKLKFVYFSFSFLISLNVLPP